MVEHTKGELKPFRQDLIVDSSDKPIAVFFGPNQKENRNHFLHCWNRHEKLKQQVMERLRPCFHCQHTGWIHTDDDIPDQMCPYCFVGKAVLKCYRETTKIQLGDYDNLKAKADKHDALLAALKKSKSMIDHIGHPEPVCVDGAFPTEDGCDQCQWCDEYQQILAALEGEQNGTQMR